jgi:hypothetical protein
LKAEGWPVDRIQINWFDSSLFYSILKDDLEGRGLAATHQICSEKSVDWYKTSPGKQALMALGDYPCSDGPDFHDSEAAPQGLKWAWLPGGQGRRPSPDQIEGRDLIPGVLSAAWPMLFELDAEAFSGHVNSTFPVTMQGTISPKKLRGVVNNGGATLRIKTFSGSIDITKK